MGKFSDFSNTAEAVNQYVHSKITEIRVCKLHLLYHLPSNFLPDLFQHILFWEDRGAGFFADTNKKRMAANMVMILF